MVSLLRWHPDPSALVLLSAADDYHVLLWDLKTSTALAVLDGHVSLVRDIAFSADSSLLFTAGRDKVVLTWSMETHSLEKTIPVFEVSYPWPIPRRRPFIIIVAGSSRQGRSPEVRFVLAMQQRSHRDGLCVCCRTSRGSLSCLRHPSFQENRSEQDRIFSSPLPAIRAYCESGLMRLASVSLSSPLHPVLQTSDSCFSAGNMRILSHLRCDSTARRSLALVPCGSENQWLGTVTFDHNVHFYDIATFGLAKQIVGNYDEIIDARFLPTPGVPDSDHAVLATNR